MTLNDYESVLLPKVRGSWNLHRCLARTEIDFFVMLGSAVSVTGNPGQSNYAAASAFQDALSCHRVSLGLPSVTIDLGIVQGAGFVFENPQTKAKLKQQCYDEIQTKELQAMLQFAIIHSAEHQISQIITGLNTSEELKGYVGDFGKDVQVPLWIQDPKFSHLRATSVVMPRKGDDPAQLLNIKLNNAQTPQEGLSIVLDAVLDKLSRLLMIPKENLSPNHSTATLGVDSLIGVELRNWILHELKADISLFEILGKASIFTLSHQIATKSELLDPAVRDMVNRKGRSDPPSHGRRDVAANETASDGPNGTNISKESDRVRKMRELVELYTQGLQTANAPLVEDDRWTVILIGSTGSVGSYLLERLLQHCKVIKIICLNRSANGKERQIEGNALRDLPTEFTDDRVEYLQASIGTSNLGLAPKVYRSLLSSATHVIHAAWKLDFISPIEAFEHDYLCSVRSVIQFSISSTKAARIYFLSSLSAALDWNMYHPGPIPEKIIDDYNIAVPLGYCEAKMVAEQMLGIASKQCGIPTFVIRAGQITSPAERKGLWNRTEWFPSILASGRYLGLLPESLKGVDTIDWIPVDDFAQTIIELINGAEVTSPAVPKVYNIVNPQTTQWNVLLPAIIAHFNQKQLPIRTVPFNIWLNALRQSATNNTKSSASQNPAFNFLELFRVLAQRDEPATPEIGKSLALSSRLGSMEPVQEGWMVKWMQEWEL